MEKKIKKVIALVLMIAVSAGFIFLYGNFVLGQEMATCPSNCQEYAASECDSKCASTCYPATRDKTPGCKLGTCFDTELGTCQERALSECNKLGGEILENPNDNKCQKGCCVIGKETIPSITRRECEWRGESKNAKIEYSEGKDGNSCFDLAAKKAEGACVYQDENKKSCYFIKREDCLRAGGEFAEGLLCSHPDLNTSCEKQATAKCADDKLYWLDSCGNKENIYDSNKARSWNNGNILLGKDSCQIGTSGEKLKNQETCGNCDRFLGSVCTSKTSNERLSDNSLDFVCKDMRCKDRDGNTRQNGEGWCKYQGHIGVEKGAGEFLRSVDTPGSGHFREICKDGEIITEPCLDSRREICVEDIGNGEIGTARCIENKGSECLTYNETKKERKLGILAFVKNFQGGFKKCEEDSQCFLKEVNLADNFHFGICLPKYPPGFDLKADESISKNVCKIASLTCVVTYQKDMLLGWKCVNNCKCEKPGFAEQMNDLCMSLGDCGASVNYIGDLTENYNVIGNKEISEEYIKGISEYSKPNKEKSIKDNLSAYSDDLLGISDGISGGKTSRYEQTEMLGQAIGGPLGGDTMRELAGPVIAGTLGIGDTKRKRITFECLPWRPPFGGAKCGECGKDGLKCTKYACESLGTTCELKNEWSSDEACIDTNPGNISSPKISPLEDALEEGYKYEEVSDSGAKIVGPEECLKENTELSFGIKLDKEGYCAYDFKHTVNYSGMNYERFGGINTIRKNHNETLFVPDLLSFGVPEYIPGRQEDFNIFIRCLNINGYGEDSKEYIMKFCIKPKEDKNSPWIRQRYPENEIAFNTKEIEGAVLVNEPATCKWSTDSRKKYDEMENKMECANSVAEREKLGWRCNAAFPVKTEENKFYIKCKDQPWYGAGEIEADESKRNEMPNAYEFILKKTKTPLSITSVKPNNETFIFGVVPATIDLEVETSGGADGNAECSLIIGGNFFPMEGSGTSHKQEGLYVKFDKENVFKIFCEDEAGNIAEAESRFNTLLDITPPVVIRAYNLEGELIIITNEEGECAFVKGGKEEMCGFDFANNSTLMSGEEFRHSTSFEKGIYYIKCKDKWDKISEGCSIIVRGANNYE